METPLEQLHPSHTKTPILKVIRQHCIECCGGYKYGINSPSGCNSTKCNLYPYRMGKNPFWNKS